MYVTLNEALQYLHKFGYKKTVHDRIKGYNTDIIGGHPFSYLFSSPYDVIVLLIENNETKQKTLEIWINIYNEAITQLENENWKGPAVNWLENLSMIAQLSLVNELYKYIRQLCFKILPKLNDDNYDLFYYSILSAWRAYKRYNYNDLSFITYLIGHERLAAVGLRMFINFNPSDPMIELYLHRLWLQHYKNNWPNRYYLFIVQN